jgi:hypothetical protein
MTYGGKRLHRFVGIVAVALLGVACGGGGNGGDGDGRGASADGDRSETGSGTAPSGANPFAVADKLCLRHDPPSGTRNSSSPGVTPDRIVFGEGSTDAKALAKVGASVVDTAAVAQALVDEINEACGGINGRQIALAHINNNPLNPDPVSMLTANCLEATEERGVFLMLANTNLPPFPRCAAAQHKTIVIMSVSGGYDTQDLADSKGRILSSYPPNDQLADAFVDFAVKHSLLEGEKVMVVGIQQAASASAQDLNEQYVEPMKAEGIDAYLEVVPCIGTSNCRTNVDGIVAKAKSRGVTTIVTTHLLSGSTLGTIWKNLASQRYAPKVVGPTNLTIHSDPQQPGMLNDAGEAAGRFVAEAGQTSYSIDEANVVGAWRVGYKQTPFADACLEVVNRRLGNDPPWAYNEHFLSRSEFNAATSVCKQIRAAARAIWSLGTEVTTARVAAALARDPGDKIQDLPEFRAHAFYSRLDPRPTKMTELRYHFPCPGASVVVGCMRPTTFPIRLEDI